MPSLEALKPLPEPVLWEFLKWLAFGQGRYTGVVQDDALRRIQARFHVAR